MTVRMYHVQFWNGHDLVGTEGILVGDEDVLTLEEVKAQAVEFVANGQHVTPDQYDNITIDGPFVIAGGPPPKMRKIKFFYIYSDGKNGWAVDHYADEKEANFAYAELVHQLWDRHGIGDEFPGVDEAAEYINGGLETVALCVEELEVPDE